MQKRVALCAVLVGAACQRPQSHEPATSPTGSDSAAIVAITARNGFELLGLSVTSYPDIPFRVGAALLQHDSVARVMIATIDSQGVHKAYDAEVTVAGCGDPAPEIPVVDRLRVAKRLLLRVQVRRRDLGCTSVGTTDFRTVHLLDAAHGFREVLTYQTDSLEYGNAEEGAMRPVVFRHMYDYPDVCLEDGCQVLAAIVVSSERRGWQGVFRWHWNADSTALVPEAKQPMRHASPAQTPNDR